jgi:Phage integrase family
LSAAHEEGADWYAAVCLCGEAGLRIGEVRALAWSDVDMKAATITVSRQRRHGVEGTPKGRTRRTIPMTRILIAALRALNSIRAGYVIRNLDGTPKTDGQDAKAIQRIYKRAGVPKRRRKWHLLRNTFGAHAALFGVNPWTLMSGWDTSGSTRPCCTSSSPKTIRERLPLQFSRREPPKVIPTAGSSRCSAPVAVALQWCLTRRREVLRLRVVS